MAFTVARSIDFCVLLVVFDKEKRRKTGQPQCFLRWHKLKNATSPIKMSWNMKQPLQSKWPGRASAQELPPPCPRIRSEAHPPPGQAAWFHCIGGLEMPWQTSTHHLQCNSWLAKKNSHSYVQFSFGTILLYWIVFYCTFCWLKKKKLQISLTGFPPFAPKKSRQVDAFCTFWIIGTCTWVWTGTSTTCRELKETSTTNKWCWGNADTWDPAQQSCFTLDSMKVHA